MAFCNCIVCLFGKWHASSETIHDTLWFMPVSNVDDSFQKACLQCATSNVTCMSIKLCSPRASALTLRIYPEPIWLSTLVSMLVLILTLCMEDATEISDIPSQCQGKHKRWRSMWTQLNWKGLFIRSVIHLVTQISKENFIFTLLFISC